MSPKAEYRTITLTGRPPVTITEADWPEIAEATYAPSNSGSAHDAIRTWSLRVREHFADGRRIVYGTHRTQMQGERDARGGVIVDHAVAGDEYVPDDRATVEAILRVAESIGAPPHLAQECIADLPAEVL